MARAEATMALVAAAADGKVAAAATARLCGGDGEGGGGDGEGGGGVERGGREAAEPAEAGGRLSLPAARDHGPANLGMWEAEGTMRAAQAERSQSAGFYARVWVGGGGRQLPTPQLRTSAR